MSTDKYPPELDRSAWGDYDSLDENEKIRLQKKIDEGFVNIRLVHLGLWFAQWAGMHMDTAGIGRYKALEIENVFYKL